jgi:hypothetical protein
MHQGSRDGYESVGHNITLACQMLEGKTVSAILAELEEQDPVYYRLY